MTIPSLLSVENLSKRYPGVQALDRVSLTVEPGEILGLVGENGAGKSTLIKILAGAVNADSGTIRWEGRPRQLGSVGDARRLGLAFIHQELNLIPYFDAAENIFLGHPYPRRGWGQIRWRSLRSRAEGILAGLGVEVPMGVPVARLPRGQQTMISIARAFAASARLLVMDEPTATLTDQEIEHLFGAVRRLQAQGVAVVYVSHRLQEIFDLTRRVTVMRDGQVVATRPTGELDRAELIRLMTGRTALHPPTAAGEKTAPTDAAVAAPLLRAEGLAGDRVREVSFTLHRGEVMGVAGLVGAGRSELLRLLFGVDPIRRGQLLLADGDGPLRPIRPGSPQAAFRLGMALVPEERRSQGLILSRPIFENVTLTHLPRFARGIVLNRRREVEATQALGKALGLRAAGPRQAVGQLSGGNQQKVVLARCLAGDVRVLLLDEPTRGIDVGAKAELYQIVRQLTAQGVGVLLVSSELPELLELADRLLVLHEGRQVALVERSAVDQERLLQLCYGG